MDRCLCSGWIRETNQVIVNTRASMVRMTLCVARDLNRQSDRPSAGSHRSKPYSSTITVFARLLSECKHRETVYSIGDKETSGRARSRLTGFIGSESPSVDDFDVTGRTTDTKDLKPNLHRAFVITQKWQWQAFPRDFLGSLPTIRRQH